MRSCCVLVAFLVVACAKAGAPDVQGQVDSGFGEQTDASHGIQHPDADPNIDAAKPIDAMRIPDAMPGLQQVTLSQTTSSTLTAGNTVACPAPDAGTSANQYYRVFDLSNPQLGITGDFTVNTITFQVEDCESVDGDGATVSARVGTYSGTIGSTLQANDIAIMASNTAVAIPEVDEDFGPPASTPGATVNAPISAVIPANSKMIIEIDAPDGDDEYQLYMGTNGDGQSAIGYVSSPRCSPPGTTPTDVNTLGIPETDDFLITVTGTFQP